MKRLLTLLIALCLVLALCLAFSSCKKKQDVLLTYQKDGTTLTFSLNLYQLLASRAKGTLAASGTTIGGYDATQESFWNYTDKFDGETVETLDQYQSRQMLENCKFYLAAHALFSEEKLRIPDSVEEELSDSLNELIQTDAGGSKAAFNSILSDFGVNYDMLLEFYRMEKEIALLEEHLYGKNASLVGKTLKDEYLNNHYFRLYLLRLDPYSFVYETDENGDEIYYDAANNKVAYDKSGVKVVESDGSITYRLPDENGNASARYAYDKENGVRTLLLNSDGTYYETAPLAGEELEAFRAKIVEYASIKTKDAFEEVYAEESTLLQNVETVSGYASEVYLPRGAAFSSILDDISESLADMEVGEVGYLSDEYGYYYFFCRYAPESGAYENEDLSYWFTDFTSGLVGSMLEDKLRAMFQNITVDEEVLKKAPAMKDLTPDYYY